MKLTGSKEMELVSILAARAPPSRRASTCLATRFSAAPSAAGCDDFAAALVAA